jgi:pilus assembly protein CpaF
MAIELFNTDKAGRARLWFGKDRENVDAPSDGEDKQAPVTVEAKVEPTIPEKTGVQREGQAFEGSVEYTELKVRLHRELLELMNLSALEQISPSELHIQCGQVISELLDKDQTPLNSVERKRLVDDVVDEVIGLGPIEPLIKDSSVSDIVVNTHSQVFVERAGLLEETEVKFKDERHLLRIIDKIVSQVGRRIDESSPMVDARLPDGSRVNAVIPPIAVDGPLLSIRKFAEIPFDLQMLVDHGSLVPEMAEVFRHIIGTRLNVLVSGGTGSGKTTMLNALSRHIGSMERIVTIEDAAELQLQQKHVVRMETRPPNIEGKGQVSQRDLVVNSLRMRPDRIIVGEVRGGEAFDMLQAMNTGHDGSLTTVHANTPRDALSRIEQMIGMAGFDFPARSMRAQIASAIDIVIQVQRFSDGKRRTVSLQEITGMEQDIITMQEIFTYEQRGVDPEGKVIGEYMATGVRPNFAVRLERMGKPLPRDLFSRRVLTFGD